MTTHDTLIDEGYEALYAGNLELARTKHTAVAKASPDHRDTLLLEVDILEAGGMGEEAISALEENEKKLTGDLVLGFRYATLLLDIYSDVQGARPVLEDVYARLEKGESPFGKGTPSDEEKEEIAGFTLELLLALSDCRAATGDGFGAFDAAEKAATMAPDDVQARVTLASAHFDLCELADAQKVLSQTLDTEPQMPDAIFLRGRIATLEKRHDDADADFKKANALDPERFALPTRIDEDAFVKVMKSTLGELPDEVAAYLDNVAIAVEDVPVLERLKEHEPPMSPGVLGLYEGTPPQRQVGDDIWSKVPTNITLFRKNIELSARDDAEMRRLIHDTLLSEVGHFLGLVEEDFE